MFAIGPAIGKKTLDLARHIFTVCKKYLDSKLTLNN